jgi:UDP-3-O-[3-hydroxymyristoyl] glucosamine N-acyltransferase
VAIKLADLAVRYGCELRGDPDLTISSVGTLQAAEQGALGFLANPLYRKYLPTTAASAVVLTVEMADECNVACLVAKDPYAVYAAIANELYPPVKPSAGAHASAVVGAGAIVPDSCEISAGAVLGNNVRLGERSIVGPNCVVGDNCVLGEESRLVANITLYTDVKIGNRCIVHASTVIGADGFGIAQTSQGWLKVPQIGGVTIGNDVEIGAACTIDRGAIEDTVIGNGVKLDDQIHIAHNVRIGDHTVMAGQSGISGSTTVGSGCVIGGATAIAGHLEITDGVFLMGRSNVSRSITKPGTYASVIPVEEAGKWRKLAARFKRLDEMAKKLRSLERAVNSAKDSQS